MIPKWHNSLDKLFINLNGKQQGYIALSSRESLLPFETLTFPHIVYLIHPNTLFSKNTALGRVETKFSTKQSP